MTIRKNARRKANPSRPPADAGLLVQADHLLTVGVASLLAHTNEGTGRPESASIQAIVQAARRNVELWIDARSQREGVPRSTYQALSILMLMDALLADDEHDFDSIYCDPILNGLQIAQELVERVLNEEDLLSAEEAA